MNRPNTTFLAALTSVVSLLGATDLHAAKLKVPKDYATIAAALAATSPGDIVSISKGTYVGTLSVVGLNDVTIEGKGEVILDAGGADRGIHLTFCTDVRLSGLTVRNAEVDGILVAASPRTVIDDCRVEHCAGVGIRLHISGGHEVRYCEVQDVAGDGVVINSVDSYMHHTDIVDSANISEAASLRITASGNTIERNRIEDNGFGYGIVIGAAGFTTNLNLVMENSVSFVGEDAIRVIDAEDTSILDNLLREPKFDGIDLEVLALRTVVDGNVIDRAGNTGLEVSADDCQLSRNKVKKSAADGAWISNNADSCLFMKNSFKKSGNYGIYADCNNTVFIANVAKKSAAYDMSDSGSSNSFVSNLFETIE